MMVTYMLLEQPIQLVEHHAINQHHSNTRIYQMIGYIIAMYQIPSLMDQLIHRCPFLPIYRYTIMTSSSMSSVVYINVCTVDEEYLMLDDEHESVHAEYHPMYHTRDLMLPIEGSIYHA